LGGVANPLDGGTDVRLVEQVPAAERGPGEEYPVGNGDDPLGHDSSDAQSIVSEGRSTCVSVSQSGLSSLIGQTLSEVTQNQDRHVVSLS
jgi:hypothetical protein